MNNELEHVRWLAERMTTRERESGWGVNIVVKVGGSIQDDRQQMRAIARDIALLKILGLSVIVVHGGGKAISAAMSAAGLTPRFVFGQRYTDEETLAIAERVLCGQVNAELCDDIEAGDPEPHRLNVGVATSCTTLGCSLLRAKRQGVIDKAGVEHDLGCVGRVVEVDTHVLGSLMRDGVPVIAPVAMDMDKPGGRLNVNADLAAGFVAAQDVLHIGRFVLVSDTAGIRTDPKDPASARRVLTLGEIDDLKQRGTIDGGMLPKVEACAMALHTGCEVCIVDGRQEHALLRAFLSDDLAGLGTRIVS